MQEWILKWIIVGIAGDIFIKLDGDSRGGVADSVLGESGMSIKFVGAEEWWKIWNHSIQKEWPLGRYISKLFIINMPWLLDVDVYIFNSKSSSTGPIQLWDRSS